MLPIKHMCISIFVVSMYSSVPHITNNLFNVSCDKFLIKRRLKHQIWEKFLIDHDRSA